MHGFEARVDVALFATANAVHSRLHVIVNPTPRNATKHAEGVPVGVKQHLVCLQRIGPHQERPAM